MSSSLKKLSMTDIKKKIRAVPKWELNSKNTEISRVFHTHSFIAGLSHVARIAVHAELLNHHPDIELSYGKIKIFLTTHDLKGLSKLDFELAEKIDSLSIK